MSNFAIFRVIGSLLGVVYGMIPGRREKSTFSLPWPPNFLENCIIAPGKLDAAIL